MADIGRRHGSLLVRALAVLACSAATACADREAGRTETADGEPALRGPAIPAARFDTIDPEELERGRLDPSWRRWAEVDWTERGGQLAERSEQPDSTRDQQPPDAGVRTLRPAETFEDISPATVNAPPRMPFQQGGAGPSLLHAQILLDRANFSPGAMDGSWGVNTEKAIFWFQAAHGLPATGNMDEQTYRSLRAKVGNFAPIERHTLTDEELEGPFVEVPGDLYQRAGLPALGYESATELLGERFHTTPDVLQQLNPGTDLNALEPGMQIQVPAAVHVERAAPTAGRVSRIVVSKQGYYTQALDADGKILLHFPSTLGEEYDRERFARLEVKDVVHEPHFHYQPDVHGGPPEAEEAMLPPGPNSPVGVVWMALSAPSYGIHGTGEPNTIGYATSAGCVRLTNWDAVRLANHISAGTPVEFR